MDNKYLRKSAKYQIHDEKIVDFIYIGDASSGKCTALHYTPHP